jgi:hypothetical protein
LGNLKSKEVNNWNLVILSVAKDLLLLQRASTEILRYAQDDKITQLQNYSILKSGDHDAIG